MQIRKSNLKAWIIVISAKSKVIRNMNVKPGPCMHQNLKVTATIFRNMDIEPLNVDPNPCGHQTSQQKKEVMDTTITGITIQLKVVIIVKIILIPENCIRTHFSDNYNRWLSQTTCFSCLKTGHISKHYPTRSKVPSCEFNKRKIKEDLEHTRGQMNKPQMQHIKQRDHFT